MRSILVVNQFYYNGITGILTIDHQYLSTCRIIFLRALKLDDQSNLKGTTPPLSSCRPDVLGRR